MTETLEQFIKDNSSEMLWGEVPYKPLEGYEIELVERFGGEGQGDDIWAVFRFKNETENFLIKVYGWYSSYGGAEYTGFKEVTPRQKTITVYE